MNISKDFFSFHCDNWAKIAEGKKVKVCQCVDHRPGTKNKDDVRKRKGTDGKTAEKVMV